jgi:hypothetical protein
MDKPLKMSTVFKHCNKQYQIRTSAYKYLKNNFEIDDETLEYFLSLLGKSLKEQHEIYKKKSNLLKFNMTNLTYENYDTLSDNSSDEEYINVKPCLNFPDLDFENKMREEFQEFLIILQQDQQDFLFNNVKIDDFYRLFAPFYNPIF